MEACWCFILVRIMVGLAYRFLVAAEDVVPMLIKGPGLSKTSPAVSLGNMLTVQYIYKVLSLPWDLSLTLCISFKSTLTDAFAMFQVSYGFL